MCIDHTSCLKIEELRDFDDDFTCISATSNMVAISGIPKLNEICKVTIWDRNLQTELRVIVIDSTSFLPSIPIKHHLQRHNDSPLLLIATGDGELLVYELGPHSQKPLVRKLGPSCIDFFPLDDNKVLVLGTTAVLVYKNALRCPSMLKVNLPSEISSICGMKWTQLRIAARGRPSEIPILWISGGLMDERKLAIGLLETDHTQCRIMETVTGFPIEQ